MTKPLLTTAVAPDGTPVAPYLALPAEEEAALIHRALEPDAEILELGCGAGRVAHKLAELGHCVVAVDESPDMIAHVAGHSRVTPVLADIETLDLELKFRAVVLASYLVNTADRSRRARFLDTCRRYVTDEGIVVIQRLDPQARWTPGAESLFGPVHVRLAEAEVRGQIVRAQIEYRIEDQVFPQAVVAEVIGDTALDAELSRAGLRLTGWIDEQKTWLVARAC